MRAALPGAAADSLSVVARALVAVHPGAAWTSALTTAGSSRRTAAMIAKVLPPVMDIFPAVVHVFAAVPRVLSAVVHVFAAVPDILPPVARPAVVPRIPPVFPAVAHVFAAIAHIFKPVPTMLGPLRMLFLEPLVGLRVVPLELLELLLAPFLAALHQLLVALGVLSLELSQPLLEVFLPLLRELVKLLRIRPAQLFETLLASLLQFLGDALVRLGVGLFEVRQPLLELLAALLDSLLKRFGILLLQRFQPLSLFVPGFATVFAVILYILGAIARVFPAVPHIPAVIPDILNPVAHTTFTGRSSARRRLSPGQRRARHDPGDHPSDPLTSHGRLLLCLSIRRQGEEKVYASSKIQNR